MIRREPTEPPISVLEQTVDSLQLNAERLRFAHIWGRDNGWQPAESEEVLQQAAEKVERLRLSLLRFARIFGKDAKPGHH